MAPIPSPGIRIRRAVLYSQCFTCTISVLFGASKLYPTSLWWTGYLLVFGTPVIACLAISAFLFPIANLFLAIVYAELTFRSAIISALTILTSCYASILQIDALFIPFRC